MTYPANGLPSASELQLLGIPVASGTAFTHGGSDMDLTTMSGNCARSLYVTLTGNLVARLAGDAAEQTYPVTVGQVLLGAFVLLKSTSTADCIPRR